MGAIFLHSYTIDQGISLAAVHQTLCDDDLKVSDAKIG